MKLMKYRFLYLHKRGEKKRKEESNYIMK